MSQLMIQLLIAAASIAVTVFVHGFGLAGITRALPLLGVKPSDSQSVPRHPGMQAMLAAMVVVIALVLLHFAEIWLYAVLYVGIGAMPSFEQSLFFSIITYATIGYEDYGLAANWRILAALEGINGVILLGWSTAFFVTVVSKLRS